MIVQVYAVYDSRIKDFANPFYLHSDGELITAWTETVNDPQTKFAHYPDVYSVHHLGTYDSEKGLFNPNTAPELRFTALEVLTPDTKLAAMALQLNRSGKYSISKLDKPLEVKKTSKKNTK